MRVNYGGIGVDFWNFGFYPSEIRVCGAERWTMMASGEKVAREEVSCSGTHYKKVDTWSYSQRMVVENDRRIESCSS